MRTFWAMLALLVLVGSACAPTTTDEAEGTPPPDEQPATEATSRVDVATTEYSFDAPEEIEGGLVEVTGENEGEEPHQVQFFNADEGTDVGMFVDSVREDPTGSGTLELGTYAAGPNAIAPGAENTTTYELDAGSYLLVCFVPDAEGNPHILSGMVLPVEVTEPEEDVEAELASDTEVTLDEFQFGNLDSLATDDDLTVAVTNDGEQTHELGLVKVAEGSTPEDVEAFFGPDAPPGPPPFTDAGGIGAIPPGRTGYVETDLEEGTYFALCFLPDPDEDPPVPHIAKGMISSFTID